MTRLTAAAVTAVETIRTLIASAALAPISALTIEHARQLCTSIQAGLPQTIRQQIYGV